MSGKLYKASKFSFPVAVLLFLTGCSLFISQDKYYQERVIASSKRPVVYLVSAEFTGLFHTGGLGHATRGMAKSLMEQGYDVKVIMPNYTSIRDEFGKNAEMKIGQTPIRVDLDKRGDSWHVQVEYRVNSYVDPSTNVEVLLMDHIPGAGYSDYFDNGVPQGARPIYTKHPNQGEAFGSMQKAISKFIMNLPEDERPQTVILNDWTAGPLAAFLREERELGKKVPELIGIVHNLLHKGLFDKSIFGWLGIKPEYYFGKNLKGMEYNGQISFLKAMVEFVDAVYAVSGRYSKEVTTARFGGGFEGIMARLLSGYRLTGGLNGIDIEEWDPEKPLEEFKEDLADTFSVKDLERELKEIQMGEKISEHGKIRGKARLQKRYGLPVNNDVPLISMTSRVDDQKGFKYLLNEGNDMGVLERILKEGNVQIIITGDSVSDVYTNNLLDLQNRYSGQFRYVPFEKGKHERILTAYSDIFLSTAWFEPCGLNQFFSMRYGTVPFMSKVGGPAESVRQSETGLLFDIIADGDSVNTNHFETINSIVGEVNQGIDVYLEDKAAFKKMQIAAMKEDVSWSRRIPPLVALIEFVHAKGASILSEIGKLKEFMTPMEMLATLKRVEKFRIKGKDMNCNELIGVIFSGI